MIELHVPDSGSIVSGEANGSYTITGGRVTIDWDDGMRTTMNIEAFLMVAFVGRVRVMPRLRLLGGEPNEAET